MTFVWRTRIVRDDRIEKRKKGRKKRGKNYDGYNGTERRSERNLARETNRSMMIMMMTLVNGSVGKKNSTDVTKSNHDDK